MSHNTTVNLTAFALSLAINGALFVSFDRALLFNEREMAVKKNLRLKGQPEKIEFEFVEAPAKSYPDKPALTKKIAERDALNQDLLSDHTGRNAPYVPVLGQADQLAQKQNSLPTLAPQPQTSLQAPVTEQKATEPADSKKGGEVPEASSRKTAEVLPQPAETTPVIQASDLSASVTPVKGLSGQDKITTPETSRTRSAGARLHGMTSFEATGSGMGAYMKNVKERVWLQWFPYLAFKYPQDFKGSDVVVSFTIDARGHVTIVKVISNEGSPVFAAFCMEAIQRASGFGEVPKEILALLGKDELEIRFGFYYR